MVVGPPQSTPWMSSRVKQLYRKAFAAKRQSHLKVSHSNFSISLNFEESRLLIGRCSNIAKFHFNQIKIYNITSLTSVKYDEACVVKRNIGYEI